MYRGIHTCKCDRSLLSVATREPGTAEPFISHPPLDITTIRGFLLLMSDGLYNAYASVTSSSLTVNHDVACLVQRHMDKTHSIDRVAQKVIDEISGEFRALVQREKRSDRMDDITLIVRNLGYPMGQQGTTLTAPPSLQNPFNFGQLPQQRAEMSTKHHYENSPFLSKQTSTAFQTQMSSSPSHQQPYRLATNYPKHFSQTHLHPTGQPLPSEMNTNSMFTATGQSQYPIHQPHPTGHNAQYPSSSSSSSPMRKSGSEPRVSLPPPGIIHMYVSLLCTHIHMCIHLSAQSEVKARLKDWNILQVHVHCTRAVYNNIRARVQFTCHLHVIIHMIPRYT